MKNAIWIIFLLISQFGLSAASTCPQIDKTKVFPDKIPYCPQEVGASNAWVVMDCAFKQARSWHAATDSDKTNIRLLVDGLQSGDAAVIIAQSSILQLEVCRSQVTETDGSLDSFLVMYTKPGVKNYSGPFLMYREGGMTSGLVIQSPHDGTDNTHESTKRAFQGSNALAMISNGHEKGIQPSTDGKKSPMSDWAHRRLDLGWFAFVAFANKFPESVHLHIHGQAARQILVADATDWPNAKHDLKDAFMAAAQQELDSQGIQKTFTVTPWRFNGFTVGDYLTRSPDGKSHMANQRYVGTEMYVGLHTRPLFLTRVVQRLETDYLKKPRLKLDSGINTAVTN